MKKREIPVKNYIIIGLLFIGTILLCLYLSSWYKMSEEAKIPAGIMTNFLPEVKVDELDNFLLENGNTILYVSSSVDEEAKRFEKNIHDYIAKEGLARYFTYIDTKDISMTVLSSKLENRKEVKKLNLSISPNLYVFKEGKIIDALYYTEKPLNSKEGIAFIEKQEVIEK